MNQPGRSDETSAEDRSIQRLYSAAMLASVLNLPLSAIRRWCRRGYLVPSKEVHKLAEFDFDEVRVARLLAQLLAAGCSQRMIDRRLAQLRRQLPGLHRPLAQLPIVVDGRRLLLRRGQELAEPHGQLLIDFDNAEADQTGPESLPVSLPFPNELDDSIPSPHELRELASEGDAAGDRQLAIDALRTLLASGHGDAEDHFLLAEQLYRSGDMAAARERYYAAIELDSEFVEARANLGCLLAEMGDLELSEAAFLGALELYPDYADAHFHLAALLDQKEEQPRADVHWRRFLELAPDSPWVEQARDRLQGD